MTVASVAVDLDEPLDVLSHLASKVTLNEVITFDDCAQAKDLILGQVANKRLPADVRTLEDITRP